ncbi:DUF2851 family protein [Streptomyces malaysiensis]|uniref:Phospholipase D n=1 Tax=Streptomyces malaysiensis TaxID=92644 RepID=A0A7X5XE59_STRMQ|nr:DUF2851 family protein [Streptomyces malaysiensis]NIY70795.1 phospholipase D [Streptomyces malaysiensis]
MTDEPIRLDRDQVASLARLLREIEQFLDECDGSVEEALAAHFGLNPASEAFSAALCFHADRIETALATDPPASRTPTRRIHAVHNPSGQTATR